MGADARVGVLHIISGLTLGGAERMLLWSARAHDRERFRLGVVSLSSGGPLAEPIRAAGVPVVELGWRPAGVRMRDLSRLLSQVRRFSSAVLQGHMFHANILVRLLRPFLPGVVVLNTRHIDREGIVRRLVNALTRFAVDGTLAFSPAAARGESGARWWGGELRVVPYGIELPAPPAGDKGEARALLGLPREGWLFLAMGRYTAQKGFPCLISAFASMARDRRSLLLLVGEGEDEARLKDLARSRGLGGRVHFLPPDVRPQRFYAAADAFVLSSLWEAGPLVVMEAQAACLPVIATRVGAVPSMVEEGRTGLLVAPGDVSALARAMGEMMAVGDAAAWGRAAREKAERDYSFSRTQRGIEDFYLALLARRGHGSGEGGR
jgi:glycosyltransferase involved in cell wall biosynthesis